VPLVAAGDQQDVVVDAHANEINDRHLMRMTSG
jgi:hypothetical protein